MIKARQGGVSSVTPGKEQIRGEVGHERREEKIQQGDSRTATTLPEGDKNTFYCDCWGIKLDGLL